MSQTNMARKLTLGELGLTKAILQAHIAGWSEGQSGQVAFLIGKVDGYKEQANKLDPTKTDTKFVGSFEGHNLLDGAVAVSRYAYLPGGSDEMIRDAVDASEKAGNSVGVEFAFSVNVKKMATSAVGYIFQISAASEPRENDPLQALRDSLKIAAPSSVAAIEDQSESKQKGSKAKKEG